MIFQFEMKEKDKKIDYEFADFLKNWIESDEGKEWVILKFGNLKGKITKLSERWDLEQGSLSNIIAKRRGTVESWRRMVAKDIGKDYDEIIKMPDKSIQKNFSQKSFEPEISDKLIEIHRQSAKMLIFGLLNDEEIKKKIRDSFENETEIKILKEKLNSIEKRIDILENKKIKKNA